MTTVTRNSDNKSQLKINGNVAIQAANGEGERIQEEMLKFGKNTAYVVPTKLNYEPKSKCWTNQTGKVVLFNVAENPKLAVAFVKEYLTGEKAAPAKTDVSAAPLAGVVTTDSGVIVGLDTETEDKKEAVKIERKK